MDEYSFENYKNFQYSDNFSDLFLNDFQIEEKINSQHFRIQNQELKQEKDDTFATNFTYSVPSSDIQKPQNIDQIEEPSPQPRRNHRQIRKIEISNRIQILNKFTFSGSKNDTVELNTNFKTLFKRFIREKYQDEPETVCKFLIEFEKGVSSFKAFSQLYDSSPQIKDLCSKLVHSSRIIKRIMSSRAKFWMRLQMTKYIEALNRNLQSDTLVRWKSIRKENI